MRPGCQDELEVSAGQDEHDLDLSSRPALRFILREGRDSVSKGDDGTGLTAYFTRSEVLVVCLSDIV